MKYIYLPFHLTLLFQKTSHAQTGPAGVGNSSSNKIWLDASSLAGLSDGASMTTFTDRSGNAWNGVQTLAANKPTYVLNQLNGNPVVRFNRNSAYQYLK